MALNMHAGLKQRLSELLAAALPKVQVTNNSFLDWESFPNLTPLDAAVPGPKTDIQKGLVAYIGDLPLRTFITGVLSDELLSRPFEGDGPKRITSLKGAIMATGNTGGKSTGGGKPTPPP